MEKSPPRSYKKQQKIEKRKNYSRKEKRKKSSKVTNINQSLSTTTRKS
jgi:hypothetical protein